MDHGATPTGRPGRIRLLVVLLLGAGVLWASWPALREMVARWSRDPRYSHGYLVPAFAAFLLWARRDRLAARSLAPSWWGVPLIAVGEVLRLAGARYYIAWVEGMALLPSLAGLALLAGGWTALRWAGPAIGFLAFMVPLPYRLEMALGYPLQRVATLASNYALQTLGLPSVAEGNVILLDDIRIGVVEACNGLGMLVTFFAFAVGCALLIRRPPLDKALIVLGAIPIALAANVTRIVVTGLLHVAVGAKVADAVYHDLAGWLMMPLALAALWGELFLLSHLFIEPASGRPAPIGLIAPGDSGRARGQRPASGRRPAPHPGGAGASSARRRPARRRRPRPEAAVRPRACRGPAAS